MQVNEFILSQVDRTRSILDVGIGQGEIWKAAGLQANVKGFDINNKNPGVEVVMGNVCLGLPFQAKSFSTGVMINVLEVLPESCKQHAVNELLRVCDVGVVVSKEPLIKYTGNHVRAEFFSDAVNGVQWYGMVLNKNIAVVQTGPKPAEPVAEVPPAKVEEPKQAEDPKETEGTDENEQDEVKKKKPPFWRRKLVRAARYASIIIGTLNFFKYLFSNETVTVPVEFATIVPIVGGSLTHYKVTMATYEAIMTVKNYFSKQ